jgi:hypothetical protein
MSLKPDVRLSPTQRFGRGLKYTALGPVDLTRGTLGIGLDSVQSTASWARKRYRKSGAPELVATAQETIAQELADAQELVANLSQSLQDARKPKRRRRPLVLLGVGAVVLAGGAVTFSIVRRSTKPEPSPLPPSVAVEPKV